MSGLFLSVGDSLEGIEDWDDFNDPAYRADQDEDYVPDDLDDPSYRAEDDEDFVPEPSRTRLSGGRATTRSTPKEVIDNSRDIAKHETKLPPTSAIKSRKKAGRRSTPEANKKKRPGSASKKKNSMPEGKGKVENDSVLNIHALSKKDREERIRIAIEDALQKNFTAEQRKQVEFLTKKERHQVEVDAFANLIRDRQMAGRNECPSDGIEPYVTDGTEQERGLIGRLFMAKLNPKCKKSAKEKFAKLQMLRKYYDVHRIPTGLDKKSNPCAIIDQCYDKETLDDKLACIKRVNKNDDVSKYCQVREFEDASVECDKEEEDVGAWNTCMESLHRTRKKIDPEVRQKLYDLGESDRTMRMDKAVNDALELRANYTDKELELKYKEQRSPEEKKHFAKITERIRLSAIADFIRKEQKNVNCISRGIPPHMNASDYHNNTLETIFRPPYNSYCKASAAAKLENLKLLRKFRDIRMHRGAKGPKYEKRVPLYSLCKDDDPKCLKIDVNPCATIDQCYEKKSLDDKLACIKEASQNKTVAEHCRTRTEGKPSELSTRAKITDITVRNRLYNLGVRNKFEWTVCNESNPPDARLAKRCACTFYVGSDKNLTIDNTFAIVINGKTVCISRTKIQTKLDDEKKEPLIVYYTKGEKHSGKYVFSSADVARFHAEGEVEAWDITVNLIKNVDLEIYILWVAELVLKSQTNEFMEGYTDLNKWLEWGKGVKKTLGQGVTKTLGAAFNWTTAALFNFGKRAAGLLLKGSAHILAWALKHPQITQVATLLYNLFMDSICLYVQPEIYKKKIRYILWLSRQHAALKSRSSVAAGKKTYLKMIEKVYTMSIDSIAVCVELAFCTFDLIFRIWDPLAWQQCSDNISRTLPRFVSMIVRLFIKNVIIPMYDVFIKLFDAIKSGPALETVDADVVPSEETTQLAIASEQGVQPFAMQLYRTSNIGEKVGYYIDPILESLGLDIKVPKFVSDVQAWFRKLQNNHRAYKTVMFIFGQVMILFQCKFTDRTCFCHERMKYIHPDAVNEITRKVLREKYNIDEEGRMELQDWEAVTPDDKVYFERAFGPMRTSSPIPHGSVKTIKDRPQRKRG